MNKPTKKLLLQIMSEQGARKHYPGPHVEDRQEFIDNVTAQLIEQGANREDIIIDSQKISIGTQFWHLPRHSRDGDLVKVQVRSKDIITTGASGEPCYGDQKGWQVAPGADGVGWCLQHVVSNARLYPIA